MSPDPLPAPGAAHGGRPDDGSPKDLRRRVAKVLRVLNPVSLSRRLAALERGLDQLDAEMARALQDLHEQAEARVKELAAERESRVVGLERRLDAIEEALRRLQTEIERVRDAAVPAVERRADVSEENARRLEGEVASLRDTRLPAAVRRFDVLVDRLADEIEEVASLVERQLRSEPLPVPRPGEREDALAGALARVQPALLEAFRGESDEIRHRLEPYLDLLRPHAPVLDLGCGRGELLGLLREAGVEARGVEADPALATACRRRGLEVVEGDVGAVLAAQPESGWGAVTAIHLLEHLPPAELLAALNEIRRVLRPGGLLLAECPNPLSLRVGGALYWLDPTHQRPLLAETLALFLRASGFSVEAVEPLHPFPEDQLLAPAVALPVDGAEPALAELGGRLTVLAGRLDAILNGPRDFLVRARVPAAP